MWRKKLFWFEGLKIVSRDFNIFIIKVLILESPELFLINYQLSTDSFII